MSIRTKIICTIGPSVDSLDRMIELVQAGMNIARLNFSHGTHAEHLQAINNLKEVRRRLKIPLAIMLDTKGPEIRIGKIQNDLLTLLPGHRWQLVKESVEGNATRVSITPGSILEQVKLGTTILFDDGYISSSVVDISREAVTVEIHNGGIIKSGKGVNIPNENLNLPAVTEKDVADIRFGCKNDIDIIAASFVRSPEHVLKIKKLLDEEKKSDILIVAKIES